MKRIILLVIAAALAVFTACNISNSDSNSAITPATTGAGTSEQAPVESTSALTDEPEETQGPSADFPAADLNSVFANHQYELAFETEDSIYYVKTFRDSNDHNIKKSMICVTDKEYMDWMPLCGRPDCMHDTEDCNAWLDGLAYGKIWLYGDRIYYAFNYDGIPELWRMKLDGTDHEKMLRFSLPDPNDESTYSWSWTFHNKYLIANYMKMEGPDGSETTTYVVDLSARKLEQKALDAVLETGEKTFVGKCIAGKDNIVYHWQSKNVETVDPASGEAKTKAITSLYKTDLETGTTRKLCVLPFQPPYCNCSLEGDLLYICGSTDESVIFTVNTDTGELKTVNTAELCSVCWFTPYHGYIFGTTGKTSSASDGTPLENLGTFFYDLSGELICSIPYESYSAEISILFALGDRLFGIEQTDEPASFDSLLPTWYLDLSEIGTDALAWRRWEP